MAVSGLAAGAVTFGSALALRARVLTRDWVTVWAGLGVVGLGVAGGFASELDSSTAGLAVAGGVAFVAGASAIAASPSGEAWMREASSFLLVAAAVIAASSIDLGAAAIVAVASGAGIVAVLAAAALTARRPAFRSGTEPASPWLRPAVLLAGLASVIAVGAACTELPGRELLVPALAVAGLEAAVLGLALRRFEVLAASPVLLCASWLAFASEALTGEPQWFTVPIGITVLAVEGLAGAAIRARGGHPAMDVLRALDYVGMAFVVGAALAQTVVEGPVYGLIGAALGAALAAWGAATRVRRRAIFGAGSIALSLLLMLAVPLADLVPRLEGAALWATVAALGLVAIVIAALLEQGRRRIRTTVARIEELTHDWE